MTNPYWIFEFISNDTGNSTLMIASDYSPNTARYNVFTFSEGSSATASGGFTLNPGTYDYQVWQSQYNTFNLASASSIVEIGLMQIVGTISNYQPIYTSIDDDTEYVYNG